MATDEWLIYLGSAVSGSLVIMLLLLISIAKEFCGERSSDQRTGRHL